jgi:signal transduction histidine kinase
VADKVPLEAERIERLAWLVRVRWLAALGVGATALLAWIRHPDQVPLLPLVGVALIIALYNVQFFFYGRFLRSEQEDCTRKLQAVRLTYAQTILDVLALTALIHFSGGAESPLLFFFVLPVALAGMLLSRSGSLLLAGMATVFFAAIVGLEYQGFLPHHHPPMLNGVELYRQIRYLLTVVGMLLVALALAAYLTSSIGAGLRTKERGLIHRLEVALDKGQELERMNDRLLRLDSERTRFLTMATHELRAPINTVHTCIELALAGYASPEKVREILERVKERTAELSDLIGDLLRLAQAREETDRDERIELIQPAAVLQSVVQLMKAEADNKDLFLSADIEPDLMPIRANPERLKLVWTNLLSNAIKYTEPGGIVAVSLKQTPECLVGTVRDTGIGILAQDQERIFEEFYRAENARAVSPVGTGVGLAIVRRIIENWGGQISVESELGLGSKFTMVLPGASD